MTKRLKLRYNFCKIKGVLRGEMKNTNVLNYNYDAIKYFICVAKNGSLTMASKTLGISQSALSQSMKNLEQNLGITLFNRNTRGIILTEEGKVLYEQARIGDKYFKEAIIETLRKKSFQTSNQFKISISSSLASIFFTKKIRLLLQKIPNFNIEFCSHTRENEVVNALQTGKYDLIILKSHDEFSVKEVDMKKIGSFHYVFVYDPAYFDLPETITFEQLSKFYVLMKERTGQNDNSWIKYSFGKFVQCLNDKHCLELIKTGAGIGLYPKELAEQENLKVVNVEGYMPTKRTIFACYLNSNSLAKTTVNEIIRP